MKDNPLSYCLVAMVILCATLIGLSLIDKKEDGPVLLGVVAGISSIGGAMAGLAKGGGNTPQATPTGTASQIAPGTQPPNG